MFNKIFSVEVKSKILEVVKLLKNEILSYNDLNRENILLVNNNEIMFIDFEYLL